MNIKSLLLGSAAALVAVSGARAADAVVIAEPEPMEYVRVCDTYGVGFYYIPGTETCLKVSGYMRYDIGVGYNGNNDLIDRDGDFGETNDGYHKRARFALRTDARSETELGTLRVYAELRFNYQTGTSAVSDGEGNFVGNDIYTENTWDLNHGYIELGGFRVGKTDSLFSTFTGYSSGVANDGIVPYGPFGTHQIAYTFTGGNGFNAAVAVEMGAEGDYDNYTVDSYVPHVVGGLGYTAGWGGVSGVVGYDSVYEEFAVKGRVDFNATEALTLFVMAGWKSNGGENVSPGDVGFGYDGYGQNYYGQWGGDWALWVGGAWQINEKTTLNVEVGYDDFSNFSTVVGLDYELVNNFIIKPEIVYADNFDYDDTFKGGFNDQNWGGFLRFQANFGG
jgi:hypothetical protein